jgi:hypothetical protein
MAISVDDTTVVRWTGTPAHDVNLTSAAFTPPNSSLLVLTVQTDSASATTAPVVAVSSSPALTWTKQAQRQAGDSGAQGGHASVWTAPVTTGQSTTVSVQHQGSTIGTDRMSCKLYIVTGHDAATPAGATGTGSSTTNSITPTLFTSQTAGVAFVAGTDWNALGAGTTPPTSSDLTRDAASYNTQIDVLSGYKTIASAGASVTANLDAAGTAAAAWNWAAVEVRASAAAFTWQPLTAPEVPARRPTVPVSYL